MARFVGTIQEFHHYIGPRVRNVVQTATAKLRKKQAAVCQHCGQSSELEAAHRHGRERRVIIERVLAEYQTPDSLVECDLADIEHLLLKAHMPLEETFLFLCSSCHRAYDAETHKPRVQMRTKNQTVKPQAPSRGKTPRPSKLHRIEEWAKKHEQIPHRIITAFLDLEMKVDEVERDALKKASALKSVKKFDGAYASLKTDAGNSYGQVFYDDGPFVRMHPEAREEVTKHFTQVHKT